MREVLFRAKTAVISGDSYNSGKSDGEWVKGYFYGDVGIYRIRQFEFDRADYVSYEVDPDTVCQYTGVVDKNGVKIFESDIVQFVAGIENGLFEVEYASSEFYANWIVKNNFMDLMTSMKYLQCSSELEVVGNAFDNPDLLDIANC